MCIDIRCTSIANDVYLYTVLHCMCIDTLTDTVDYYRLSKISFKTL